MKYELGEEKEVKGHILHRIHYCDGSLGGWIEFEKNLDPDSNAFISGNACVLDKATIYGNAYIYGDAEVFGNAQIYGYARVYDIARIFADARVYGNARISGNAHVFGNARVYGNARVFSDAQVSSNAIICGNAHIFGDANIYGDTWETSPLQIQGSKYFFSVSSRRHITVGCQTKTIKKWLATYKKEFNKHQFTEAQKREYKLYFNLASNMYGWEVQLNL